MRIKCEYCGQFILDTDPVCPSCGAPNKGVQRSADGIPKTIPELQQFCARHKLPLAQMRFFIGQDYKEPKAFGIYREEDGNFVVYKNKADGSRAIRYHGSDEAYAVNEIYQKMKTELDAQRARGTKKSGGSRTGKRSTSGNSGCGPVVLMVCIGIMLLSLISMVASCVGGKDRADGYYHYNDTYYYNQHGSWYTYDDDYDWIPAVVDQELEDNASDYYESSNYSSGYGVEDFGDSNYYVEPSSWDSDWDDDDWDWDSGSDSWDSDSTDWDSDW